MRLRLLLFLPAAILLAQTGNTPTSGIHPEDMDTTCKPCTDFWRYVNGGWLDKNPIPAHASSWGPFAVLGEANEERMRTILDAAAADNNPKQTANQRRMGDYYTACMDTDAIDARGSQPLQADLDRIAAIQSLRDLNSALIFFQHTGRPYGAINGAVVGPFRFTSGIDSKNPTREIARVVERDGAGRTGTSVLSLPDRDYYFNGDEKSKQIRADFLDHAARLLVLLGTERPTADAQAKTVLAFETELAKSILTIADKRDPDKTYHLMDLKGLAALAPRFDWAQLLRDSGLPETTPVNVTEPELLKQVNEQLSAIPLADWKIWLRWRALSLGAPYLAKPFSDESFRFNRTVLSGVKEAPPRWQTCAGLVDRDLSDALGEAYTAKYFPPQAKQRMIQLVENLRAAMKEEIEQADWMQPVTKQNALKKLTVLQVQVGYPDRWRDYAGTTITRGNFYEDVRSTWAWGDRYELLRIGKPVSHVDWAMTAPTVNAYSNANEVKVVFPAGILQPPFFDMQADDAANYGAIGAVIGHEMGHQFDDTGAKYDATGALKNWWTDQDRTKFEVRTGCVVDQFNTLDVGGGLHHNGKQVLGEALGDLGGLATAWHAWKKSLEGKPQPAAMDGFTPEQRFFIAYARVWGTAYRPEAMLLQLKTNNHPVSQWRAIGTLQNMPEFQQAFQCKQGDAMVRPAASRCKLW